jgi:hypothetical protein
MKTKKSIKPTAFLAITVSAIDFPIRATIPFPLPSLANQLKGMRPKKIVKRIYIPLRGFPKGFKGISVVGDHLSATFGKGDIVPLESETPVLYDAAPDELCAHKIVDNLKRRLLLEARIFMHKPKNNQPETEKSTFIDLLKRAAVTPAPKGQTKPASRKNGDCSDKQTRPHTSANAGGKHGGKSHLSSALTATKIPQSN